MKARAIVVMIIMATGFVMNACEEDPLAIFSDDPRDGLTGSWEVNEDSEIFKKGTSGFYTVSVTKDNSDTAMIWVNNFYELGEKVSATLDGRTLDIPEQTVKGFTIKGYGTVSFDFESISWAYTVILDTGDKDNVTAKYSRPSR